MEVELDLEVADWEVLVAEELTVVGPEVAVDSVAATFEVIFCEHCVRRHDYTLKTMGTYRYPL